MQLQNGSRHLRRNLAEASLFDDLRLIRACDEKNLLRLHNGADAHGDGLRRHILAALEQTGVRVDGALRQLYGVHGRREVVRRLVKADVLFAAVSLIN